MLFHREREYLLHETCEATKQNESYVGNIDFAMYTSNYNVKFLLYFIVFSYTILSIFLEP